MQETECRMQNAECRIQETGDRRQELVGAYRVHLFRVLVDAHALEAVFLNNEVKINQE
jgi:hypothetical protein